jgi:orotate phosphoribosyltransferase
MSGPLQRGLLDLMRPRKGHFRLESGYHGELWLDLDSLFLRPRLLEPFAVELARRVSAHDVDAVCGPLEGGAFLAQMIARELDLEFFYSARSAPPRGEGLYTVGYRLPAALRGAASGRRFAIVDDVVSAGSAVRGTSADLRACGAEPVVAGALLVLTSPASGPAPLDLPLERIEVLRSAIWAPSECPRCVALEPLENSLG